MNNRKNIVITGASSGIGSALALRLAAAHTHLILLARRTDKLEEVAAKCIAKQASVITHSVDVTEYEKLHALLEKIDDEFPVDLIICNAGVTNIIGKPWEIEEWRDVCKLIDTNLYGVLASVQPLVPRMQQRKHGHIAIISSLAAFYGMPVTPAYCASKSGIKAYGESLRGGLKPFEVKLSMVYPGFVKSDVSDQFSAQKPFMISAEKAADIIVKGIQKNKASITFPFPLFLGVWFLSILPASASDWIMSKLYSGGSH